MSAVGPELGDRLDAEARRALAAAVAGAEMGQQAEVDGLHVLLALLERSGDVRVAVERLGIDPRLFVAFAEVTLAKRKRGPRGLRPLLDERLAAGLSLAAARSGGRLLGTADLAAASLRIGSSDVRRVLDEFAIDATALIAAIARERPNLDIGGVAEPPEPVRAADLPPPRPAPAGRDPAAGRSPPNLSPLEIGAADAAVPWIRPIGPASGRPAAVGRTSEIAEVLAVLRQRTRRSPFLVGEAGSGRRTVLAEALARLGAWPRAPRTVTLDLLALLAGARARGDMEERLRRLATALRAEAGAVLLCIPDVSLINPATPGVGLDETLADLAEAHGLALAMVGADAALSHLRAAAPRLAAFLEPITVDEPSEGDLCAILELHAGILAAHHGIPIGAAAAGAAAELAGRYLRDPALPARAIHLLDAAAARCADAGREPSADDVAAVVASWTRIPVRRLMREETERLRDLEDTLRKSIKGQDDAVARTARAIRRGRIGLRDRRRPVGSFLFAGPTGVGKTELARRLAEALFDDDASLIRIDMSEFAERHMVARLIGSPPGYVDSQAGGVLTEAVRRRPYSVLLLDEMEKAHADVHNLLLQVLDEGRLTDARGRTFDFTHCVAIMTTNVGSEVVLHAPAGADLSETIRERLLSHFRPELLNRIDDVVVFRALDDDALREIATIALDEAAALAAPLGLRVEFAPDVAPWVVSRRDPPEFGARPVRRVVRAEVLDRLAALVIDGKAAAAASVRFDVSGGNLRTTVHVPPAGDRR